MMRTRQSTPLEDQRISVQAKLAAAWTSFMFLYVYVDILAFYKPGVVADILNGVYDEGCHQNGIRSGRQRATCPNATTSSTRP